MGRIEEGDRELGRVKGGDPVGALEAPNCVQVPLQLLITFTEMSEVASIRVRALSP